MRRAQRYIGIDRLRGVVMVLMVLDHARDFVCGFGSATNLARTTPVLFLTRWVTHLCAPTFILLAGAGAYFYGHAKGKEALVRFLWTRGLWLILLEVTVVRLAWSLDPFYSFTPLQVIWAIGVCLLVLSLLVRLPLWATVSVGLLLVGGHHLLDGIKATDWGSWSWVWHLLHQRGMLRPGPGTMVFVVYPLVPWIGVCALGYGFGAWYQAQIEAGKGVSRHKAKMLLYGALLLVAFVGLRLWNGYGDPVPWSTQKTAMLTFLSFLKVSKYPPSLMYLLLFGGLGLCLLACLEPRGMGGGEQGPARSQQGPLLIFGGVALFFYVAHLYLLRLSALVWSYLRFGTEAFQPPPGPAATPMLGLGWAYLAWVVALLCLYPLCVWYRDLKARRRDLWWLRYL